MQSASPDNRVGDHAPYLTGSGHTTLPPAPADSFAADKIEGQFRAINERAAGDNIFGKWCDPIAGKLLALTFRANRRALGNMVKNKARQTDGLREGWRTR